MAYVTRVKANEKYYYYLTIYEKNPFSSKNERNIYSLGKSKKALSNLKKWHRNMDLFPKELKEKGFCSKDLEIWILSIQEKEQKKINKYY